MDITLTSEILEVESIKKPTKAKMFCDVEVGDRLLISVPVEHVGISRGRSYAVDIKVENLNNGDVTYKTFNELPRILRNFKFKGVI